MHLWSRGIPFAALLLGATEPARASLHRDEKARDRSRMSWLRRLAWCGMLLGLTGPARAADPVVIHDTLAHDGPRNVNRLVGCLVSTSGCDQPSDPSFQWADFFVVSGGDYELDAITLRFFTSGGNIVVRLWDDAGGVPGNLLETLPVIPGPIGSTSDKTTQSVTKPLLLDGATYWFSVAMENALQAASWRAADDCTLFSNDLLFATTNLEPTTWSVLAPEPGVPSCPSPPGAFFGVARVTAPEPERVLLHASALTLVGVLARGRRRGRR